MPGKSYPELQKELENYKKLIGDIDGFNKMLELIEKYPAQSAAKRIPPNPWIPEDFFETFIERGYLAAN
jgi:hypothetical protein